MASNTPNYDLQKPASTDFYTVEDQNANMDKLDAALHDLDTSVAGKAASTHAAQHAAGGSDPVTPGSIGAAEVGHTHTPAGIGAAPAIHSHDDRYFAKAESLVTTVAALFGLGSGAVPNDVLKWIGKYNQHWWRRRIYSRTFTYTTPTATTVTAGYANTQYPVDYSDQITVDAYSGKITLVNPQTASFYYNNYTAATMLRGKYFIPNSSTIVCYADQNAAVSQTTWGSSPTYAVQIVASTVGSAVSIGDFELLNSTFRNAYHDSGVIDGYEYEYLGIPFNNSITAPKITVGSYVGTGTYGPSNPNTVNAGFPLRAIFIFTNSFTNAGFAAFVKGQTKSTQVGPYDGSAGSGYGPANITVSFSGNSVSWYDSGSAYNCSPSWQMNSNGVTYFYLCI